MISEVNAVSDELNKYRHFELVLMSNMGQDKDKATRCVAKVYLAQISYAITDECLEMLVIQRAEWGMARQIFSPLNFYKIHV